MAKDANELIDQIVADLTKSARSQIFDFDHSMESSATTLAAFTHQTIISVESLVHSGDISVDLESKIIYLRDTQLDILSLLPLLYPEMDNDPNHESDPFTVILNGGDIGSVVYKGPGESDFKKGIICVGHNTNLILREKAKYVSIDIQFDPKGDKS